jgi:hypothetical protein
MIPERLGSRYLLDERIGEGGLGVVWRGRDSSTGAVYAIKLLRAEYAQDPATVSRFVRERTALLRFRHPNVVRLHDMIVEGDRLALVMDFIANGDLNAHRQRRGGALSPGEAVGLTAQICAALAAAHDAGIVHRDLKPANVLLDGGSEVRLTDFGIARVSGEPTVTSQGYFLGTLSYIAPEVFQGGEPTPACDVYAAAVTLYDLIAGRPPFTGPAAAVIYEHLQSEPPRPPGIPDDVWRLIAACLDKEPARRLSAAEFESALRGVPWMPAASGSWRAVEPPSALDMTVRRVPVPMGTAPAGPAGLPGNQTQAAAALTGYSAGAPAGGPGYTTGAPTALSGDPVGAPASGSGYPTGAPTALSGYPAAGAGPVTDDGLATAAGRLAAAWPPPTAMPGAGVSGGPGGPRPPRAAGGFRRRAWAGGVVAVLVAAGAVAFIVTRSPGAPSLGATALRTMTASAAPTGKTGSPRANDGGGRASSSAGTAPDARVTPSGAGAPSTAPAPPLAASSGAPAPTKRSVAPSSTAPANTAWQCGPTAPATLYSTGGNSGQTMRACIRVYNGKLELQGTLSPTVASWDEQVDLVLKDASQQDHGSYASPVCTASDCAFTITITPPSRGDWTVLPEWDRYDGDYQSTGHEPGFVSF